MQLALKQGMERKFKNSRSATAITSQQFAVLWLKNG